MGEPARTRDFKEAETVGIAMAGGGVMALVFSWILGSRALRLLGLLAVVAGGGFYARARLGERHERIETAESHIRSELDQLDPVARAQVLADIARHPTT
jgi:hypothetical protein